MKDKILRLFFYPLYMTVFNVYKSYMHHAIPEIERVWYRNSLALGYWMPGKSDIDVSIQIKKIDTQLGRKIAHHHRLFRSKCKLLGELVIFSEHHADFLLQCINYYELQRDPFLLQLTRSIKNPSPEEKIIFLNKFIVANWNHSNRRFIREEKILYLLDLLKLQSPTLDLNGLKSLLGELLKTSFDNDVESFYQATQRNHCPLSITQTSFYGLLYNKLYFHNIKFVPTQMDQRLLYLNLKWELWGCFTFRYFEDEDKIRTHIKLLLNNSRKLMGPNKYLEICSLAESLNLLN